MWSRSAAFFAIGGALLLTRIAGARELSPYEKESIAIALEETESQIDPQPEGKWVEDIDVVALDVIERRDPAPGFLNWFHITSRKTVIEREVLLRRGEKYDQARVEETERNLRVQRQISVVLIVPTRGSSPDRVHLLVVTKDVWSLRLNWEPSFYNGLRSLLLQPSEENFAGRHKILNATINLAPLTYSVGIGFTDPRIGGSRLDTSVRANLIFNCQTNDVEGATGSLVYGKPLYSAHTQWAWSVGALWNQSYVRPAGSVGQSICTGRRAAPVDFLPTRGLVPYEFHQDVLRGQIAVTRSFGVAIKSDVTFGIESNRQQYRPPPELANESIAVQDAFRSYLPVSDTRLSPFAQFHGFENRFLHVIDLETLGLQEDVVLGHDVWLKAYPALRAVGSTRDLFGVYSGLAYTLPVADGFARSYVSSTIEFSHPGESDAQLVLGGHFVTPRFAFGRLIADGYFLDRYQNYLNPLVSLGGLDRLRGYRPQAFVGPNAAVVNVELRSKPIQILTVQVGTALFYDVGDTGIDLAHIDLRHGVGYGLRFAFPQIQRAVFRIDVGLPLNVNDRYASPSFVAAFEQAFGVPSLTSPGLVQ